MMEGRGVSIVVPAFNEEETISEVVDQLLGVMRSHGWDFEIIVVDDASTDGTADVLKTKEVRVIRHEENRGYGAALRTGIRSAKAEIIVITDADGTYPPAAIPELLSRIDGADMVVGARIGPKVEIPGERKFAKWVLSKLANYLSGRKIPDLNSGLRAFRKGAALKFFNILPDGFSFTTTITLAMLSQSYVVKYVPIDYHKRGGSSKVRPIRDTLNFIYLIISSIMYFNPLKVFLPMSFVVFILGIALLCYDILVIRNVGDKTVLVLSIAFLISVLGLLADLIVKRTNQMTQ